MMPPPRLTLDAITRLKPEQRDTLTKLVTSYSAFQCIYAHDPARFVSECFHWSGSDHPTRYQLRILTALPEGRVCVRAPHGVGKTAVAAWALLWFALTRDGRDWKVVITASVWRQLKQYFWPELRKWIARLRWDRIGRPSFTKDELKHLELALRTGTAFTVASDSPAHIEGAHADCLFYIFDESKAIRDETFDAAEGAFSNMGQPGREALALAISTPGAPVGRFYAIQTRQPGHRQWRVFHVTREDAVAAGQMSREWVQEKQLMWGPTSSIYLNRVEGEFAADQDDGVIPLSWVEAAVARWTDYEARRPKDPRRRAVSVLGVDVARSGTDRNVIATRVDAPTLTAIDEIDRSTYTQDTRVTLSHLRTVSERLRCPTIVLDVIGFGAGLYDELKADGYDVHPFNAAARCDVPDSTGELRFLNLRAAGWWYLRERLSPSTKMPPLALPPDDTLLGDLTAPRYQNRMAGIQVEPKEQIRKRLGRSTDVGDAVVHALAKDLVHRPIFFY